MSSSLSWLILVVAGLLEVGWAVGLKYTEGFTRLVPSLLTGAAIAASMWLLSVAARTIPIGTAYAVWVGIGAAGTAVLGVVLFGEALAPGRVLFLSLLLIAVVGLKITAG
jgi:quaternary ammonium compound-resistance protein SugE